MTSATISIGGFAEPAASWLHLTSAFVVVAATGWHLRNLRRTGHRVVFAIFCLGALSVFSMSGVFHLLDQHTWAREVLRRLDYSAIWLLVAGTLTPLFYLRFQGRTRRIALSWLWAAAAVGIVMASVFLTDLPELATLTLYFVVCGASFWALRPRTCGERTPTGRPSLLVYGCISYTVGAVVEFARAPVIIPGVFGHHEIFHMTVMVAVAMHWKYLHVVLKGQEQTLDRPPLATEAPAARSSFPHQHVEECGSGSSNHQGWSRGTVVERSTGSPR